MPFLGRTVTTNLADFHTDNYAAGSGFTAGSTTTLALTISGIDDENALRISFDGVNQHHDTWSLSSSTVTFDTAIPTGVANVEIQYGKQPTSSAFEANSVDGSHIALGSDAQGDVLYYDGSNYARLAAGTSGQFLKTQGSSANPTWAAVTTKVVQYVVDHNVAETTGSTQMPSDNTKPQNTEGFEVCSLAITPTSATNKLLFLSNLSATATNSNTFTVTQALFQDSTADCLAATSCRLTGTENSHPSFLMHYMDAGTTSETTFKIRAGSDFSGTLAVNRSQGGGARYDGTSSGNTLIILELAV